MLTVDAIIGDVLRREGWPEYSDRPSDKGGPTKGGITLATLADWLGRPASVAELRALGETEARAIYKKRYVFNHKLDAIADPFLLALMVDWTVTSWIDDPVKALQAILGVTADGRFGAQTRAALANVADKRRVYVEMIKARGRFFCDIALRHDADVAAFLKAHPKSQLHNLAGWTNRNLDFVV